VLLFGVLTLDAQTSPMPEDSVQTADSTHIHTVRLVVMGVFSTMTLGYVITDFNRIWGKPDTSFHWKPCDWNGDFLAQNDEISHFVATQRLTQLIAAIAHWVGFSHHIALVIGATGAGVIGLYVEILDGFNAWEGFGITDLGTDASGILFELLRHKYEFWSRFDLRCSYNNFHDIPDNLIIADAPDFTEYDVATYWLTYRARKDLPVDLAVGYGTTRSHHPDDKSYLLPRRRIFLGVGISAGEIVGFFSKNRRNDLGKFLDWYEFTIAVEIYRSDPIKQNFCK